ncbi:hypothetical protein RB625_32810 [Streptomyces californicus]|uniref:hypothetical protein n=1 Tax=Streptomyces californicus TaxID=67351 RepID=UPI00296FEC68|nr:hypothetical protein [Streptomyces californicus]MDW4903196.1 hypothetical protein [Streptomyces californicus]
MLRKLPITAAALGLALSSLVLMPASAQAAERPTAAAEPNCGYNDNYGGRAVWRNCGNFSHLIETWALGASKSYQCVAAYSTYTLGPTWFISSSKYAGGENCRP